MQSTVNIRVTRAAREVIRKKVKQVEKKREKLNKEPISQCNLISLAIEMLDVDAAVEL